jgi:hypothetical protein
MARAPDLMSSVARFRARTRSLSLRREERDLSVVPAATRIRIHAILEIPLSGLFGHTRHTPARDDRGFTPAILEEGSLKDFAPWPPKR